MLGVGAYLSVWIMANLLTPRSEAGGKLGRGKALGSHLLHFHVMLTEGYQVPH